MEITLTGVFLTVQPLQSRWLKVPMSIFLRASVAVTVGVLLHEYMSSNIMKTWGRASKLNLGRLCEA